MKESTISPRVLRAYYRLAKPGIVYGNLVMAAAGFFLASAPRFNLPLFIATMTGIALVMASACVVNNYTDVNIDRQMQRTKRRPLVTGAVSPRGAILYAFALGMIGFGLLIMYTNWLTVTVGMIGYVDYVWLYALAKRHSVHGTLVGTISGAAPPVAAYLAVTNQIDSVALYLFIVMVFWQMAHFYSIAMMRTGDYALAKVPVMPVVRGLAQTKRYSLFYVAAFAVSLPMIVFTRDGSWLAILSLGLIGAAWLYMVSRRYRTLGEAQWARFVFKSSLVSLLLLGCVLSSVKYLPT